MINLIHIMLFVLFGYSNPEELSIIRKGIYAKTEQELIHLSKKIDDSTNPVLKAYHGAYTAMLAEHQFFPHTKYQYFSAGRDELEQAVLNAPNSVEIRFIRMLIQHNTPAFLGYRNNLEEDFQFILDTIAFDQEIDNEYKLEMLCLIKEAKIAQANNKSVEELIAKYGKCKC